MVENSGTLDASGKTTGQTGGVVKVLGETVSLASSSTIDASGDKGGGTVLVGGNFHGEGPEQNATTTNVASGALIRADALTQGNGGNVAIWSDGQTTFNGSITARGGDGGGNGGQVETSGHQLNVGKTASVNTLAKNGKSGNWLLDPEDVIIGSLYDWGGSYNITVDTVALTNALNTTSVTIQTTHNFPNCTGGISCPGTSGNGDIIVLDLIGAIYDAQGVHSTVYWTGNTTLTLSAYRNVIFKTTDNYYSNAGGGNTSNLGGIELYENNSNANAIIRADNSGTGSGTVKIDQQNFSLGTNNSISFYHNDNSSLGTTNDYSQYLYSGLGDPARVFSYIALNVTATINDKIYDGTNAATINTLNLPGSVPSGISLSSAGATATFVDKNAGTNKSVSVSGVSFVGGISSSGGNNYYINGLESLTASITKANLSVSGVSASNKNYDGTTTATLTGSGAISALGSDVVSLSGTGVGTFADKNVGTGIGVTVSGYTLSGTDAANYNLVQPTGLIANISKANLTLSGSKTYDGTTAVGGGTLIATGVNGETFTVSGSGDSSNLSSKNVQTGTTLSSITGLALGTSSNGGLASNYNLLGTTGSVYSVSAKAVSLSGITASNKVYDTSVSASLNTASATLAGRVGADDLSFTGVGVGAFADKNVGTGKTVTVSGYSLSGSDAGNYTLAQPTGLTANITKANLDVSGVSAIDKTYDTTTAATLTGTAAISALGSDTVTLAGTGAGTFADKNVGTGKAVTVSGYTISGADAGNYNLVQPTGLTANITKANLGVSGVSASNKTYDATVTATLTGTAAVSALGSDAVTLSGTGTGTFADKNVGTGKAVTISGYTISGADAGNYNLVQPTGLTANITKADLTVSGLSASSKVYDTTTAATLTGTAAISALGSDAVTLSGTGAGAFADKNVGTGKTVTVSGYTISGADAGNYNLVQSAGLTANITKADMALSGLSASSKIYDATTAATLSGTATVSALGSDTVTLSGTGVGNFADKNVGTGKAVTVSGYTLSGADAGNYNLVAPASLTANITKANLAVSGVTASNKVYDGTAAATLAGSAAVSALGSDTVTLNGTGAGTFADKNAGTGKAVTVSGYTISGADAGNYNLVQPAGLTADITKANLTLSGSKTYDGTTAVGGSTLTAAGVNGETFTVSGSGDSSNLASKNVQTGSTLSSVTGLTLGASGNGGLASNYNTLGATGSTYSVAAKPLTLSGITASDKVYDGSVAATLNTTGVTYTGLIGGDSVSFGGTGVGAFANKNVGTNKVVTVSGYTLSGTDAGNYTLAQPTGLTASITPANLMVSGITASNKSFDGNTSATVSTAQSQLSGKIAGDDVTVAATGSFADPGPGNGKSVNLQSTYGGSDVGNYHITGQTVAYADIFPAQATTPPAPLPPVIQNTVTQVQSAILPPQAATQPQALSLSSTLTIQQSSGESGQGSSTPPTRGASGIATAVAGFGQGGPTLQILNGGVRLPDNAPLITE
nr:YDG domain-containing protein [Azospira inquinata]